MAMLTACTGTLLPKPAAAPARFTLDGGVPSSAPMPPAVAASAPALLVAPPRAAPGHDSRYMVYLRRPQALEAFAFHEWVEPPAQMLEPLLVRALQDSGAFRAVLTTPSSAASGWRLETTGLRLQQDFTVRPSQVQIGLRAVLVDTATRQAFAWREFAVSVPSAGDDPVEGAAAARVAAQKIVAEVAAFCAAQARAVANPLR